MQFTLNNPKLRYEMENLIRLFVSAGSWIVDSGKLSADLFVDDILAEASINMDGQTLAYYKTDVQALKHLPLNQDESQKNQDAQELALAHCLYRCLCGLTRLTPPWGILTGVRPTKLFRRLAQSFGEDKATKYFLRELFVTPEKTELAQTIFREQREILGHSLPQSFSLYIAIPFCPSRCTYCSFVSHSITELKARRLIPEYLQKLCDEIKITGEIAQRLGLRLESVYFGGGTPTTLEAEQLGALMQTVSSSFDLSSCREYTVEAGRPDTVSAKKFETIRKGGADRISVNPQSFDDNVLHAIGRGHSAEEAREAYRLSREYGFAVNMDFIAGLPGDSPEGFVRSISQAIALAPENITVHTLAMKRASSLNAEKHSLNSGFDAGNLHSINSMLSAHGYAPYYSYRQSKSLGALENTGWAKRGFSSAYNIYMMEEAHSVLACGAGAVTKLKQPCGENIERVFNFKFPYEYNSRFEELLARKAEITSFYGKYKGE